MCAISGVFGTQFVNSKDAVEQIVIDLMARQSQRGPDSSGTYFHGNGLLGLGHNRLAIRDLSDAGSQPMLSPCSKYVLVYNGEIYNTDYLVSRLGGDRALLKSSSDTEILLRFLLRNGLDCLAEVEGMYAFAWYDLDRREITIARDPLGIKPLYYSVAGNVLTFASQARALSSVSYIGSELSETGILDFKFWGNVSGPHTIFKKVHLLPPGSAVTFNEYGEVNRSLNHDLLGDCFFAENPSERFCNSAVSDSVKRHLVSDVPVGVFLSAGADSAALAFHSSKIAEVTGLTIGFKEYEGTPADEVPGARWLSRKLNIKHVVKYFDREEVSEYRDLFFRSMDQPTVDGFNTWLVSKVAKDHGFKVVLSGVGGDEIFGGYPTLDNIRKVRLLRRLLGVFGRRLPTAVLNMLERVFQQSPKIKYVMNFGQDECLAYALSRSVAPEICCDGATDLVCRGGSELPYDLRHLVQYLEIKSYLQPQLLRDADWASMAHSIELRTPLVDSRIYEQLVPLSSVRKSDILSGMPGDIVNRVASRQKSGFSIPVRDWVLGNDAAGLTDATSKSEAWSRFVLAHWCESAL